MATGRCLCGAVRYEVRGSLRDVLICHCEVSERADYNDLPDDGLPHHERGGAR